MDYRIIITAIASILLNILILTRVYKLLKEVKVRKAGYCVVVSFLITVLSIGFPFNDYLWVVFVNLLIFIWMMGKWANVRNKVKSSFH